MYSSSIPIMGKHAAIYVASLLLFGTNGVIAAAVPLQSAQIVMWRTLIGFLLLLVLVGLRRRSRIRERAGRRQRMFVLASGVCTGFSWVTLYEAYRLVGVGVSSLLYYCAPVVVMVLSVPLFKERFTLRKSVAFCVVLAGVLLVGVQSATAGGSVWGVLLAAASALCHAGMVVFSKFAPDVGGIESSCVQLGVSCVIAVPFALLCGNIGAAFQMDAFGWAALMFLGLANTGAGCAMYFSAIPKLPAQMVATLGYLEPMSAVVFSALLLGETMSAVQWLGALMVVGGAAFGERAKS